MRILVAIDPTMYRETFAHVLRTERPNDTVRLADPRILDREALWFRPHMIVCNENALAEVQVVSVSSWVVIRYQDGLSASVFFDGKDTQLFEDMDIEELLGVVEETRRMLVRRS